MTNKTDYDVIVIGSGAGGLTAAVALAQAGKSVLVCEQHYVAGGWCHSFTLDGYKFSPGVHYIGGIDEGGDLRATYEGLGVSQDLAFSELNPEGYDHVVIGDRRFDIPKGRDRYLDRLKSHFPQEQANLDSFFTAMDDTLAQLMNLGRVRSAGDALKAPFQVAGSLRWMTGTMQPMVDHFFKDPFLKAILLSQTGDHGVPPSQAPALLHLLIMNHYMDGGYYPIGGGFAIPRAFVRALKRAGGEIRLSTAVSKILLENGRVSGVCLADGSQISASTVISNADPAMTFGKLLDRDILPSKLRRKLDKARYSTSALSLFFAVDMDLRAAGLDSGNIWSYSHTDLDAIYKAGYTDEVLGDEPPSAIFLTATTLKDPSKLHSGHHTLEAFTFVGYDAFQKWEAGHQSEGGGAKPAEYMALKERLTEKMITAVNQLVPGIRDHIVFADLGTPLSNHYYLAAEKGNLYGIDKIRSQSGPFGFPIDPPIDGLYLCGASTFSHGVGGVTISGLMAAQKILGCRRRDLLRQNGPSLAIYPAEDISQWPEAMQTDIVRRQQELAAT